MKTLLVVLCILAVAGTAVAQCPNARGLWTTTDGSMIAGRASEAYCGVDGAPLVGGVPGNTQNAASWNGTALGTQWRAWDMSISGSGAQLIGDTTGGTGTGTMTYQTFYLGGQFWLDKDEPWADGLADLTGQLMDFQVVTTITLMGGQIVGATSNITFTGTFDNCREANNCAIEFGITSAAMVWNPALGTPMPAGYPSFLCGATAGELFDAPVVYLRIDCTIPTEPVAWGALKAQYR